MSRLLQKQVLLVHNPKHFPQVQNFHFGNIQSSLKTSKVFARAERNLLKNDRHLTGMRP